MNIHINTLKHLVYQQANRDRNLYPCLRMGQALFNSLYQFTPEVADKIRATIDDPFYDDRKIPNFWKKVETLLTEII